VERLTIGSTVSAAPITGAFTLGIGTVMNAGRAVSGFTSTDRTIPFRVINQNW
jgi:hypothetical protein